MLRDELFSTNVLHIARLTDPPKTAGKENLTLCRPQEQAYWLVGPLANQATSFCRDWRNRRFAHYDLALATDTKVTPLEAVNKEKVDDALKSLADVLNAVEHHYFKGGTAFKAIAGHGGAVALLYVLGDGIKRSSLPTRQ